MWATMLNIRLLLSALTVSNAIGDSDNLTRFLKLTLCLLMPALARKLLCRRAFVCVQSNAQIITILVCVCLANTNRKWINHAINGCLATQRVLAHALQTVACIETTTYLLQTYEPNLSTVMLSVFCETFKAFVKSATLNEFKSKHEFKVINLFWISALVCLLCAFGAPTKASYVLAIIQAVTALTAWAKLKQYFRQWSPKFNKLATCANIFRIKCYMFFKRFNSFCCR
ncbi:hypothetical protein CHOCRA_000188 [Candidatus Hodgkinia cicadicola]|nr:hypothetical protein CHOCRA_000188 [Candidatus Hodgkinia cicadicola]